MSNIHITLMTAMTPETRPIEMVERKGVGHPDTMCDALSEELSLSLSRFYLERFGFILHHNVDKGLLWGGAARPVFGGGKVLEPIEVYLCGRATCKFKGVYVPVEELAVEGTRRWIREHLRHLDPSQHVRVHCRIRPSSLDLVDLFQRSQQTGVALANDTSFGTGYAPFDDLETVVLRVEQHLNSPELKDAHPYVGEDIKVMGIRRGRTITLTVACALVDRHVRDMSDYADKKSRVRALALDAARGTGDAPVEVFVNTADGDSEGSVYITVTGTSAEAGDDGQVGRGNRGNGLITPYRPMNLEALAGKNPVTHVGKLYNVMANRIAQAVVQELASVRQAYCYLVSGIGRPIDKPQALDLQVALSEEATLAELEPRIAEVASDTLTGVRNLWREFIAGHQPVF